MASVVDILKKAGFRGNSLAMAYAIVMAESGGDARAHNPDASTGDNSYGLFQINMIDDMGPERRRIYGLSSNEALFDPLTNARVAYKMSRGGKNWAPWTTYKTGAYKEFYGGSMGATLTGGGGGSAYAATSVTPKLDKNELVEKFGLTWAMINSNKEIKSLFNKAVKEGWDATLFTAKLKNTKWWRTTPDSLRKYLLMKAGDPATYREKWRANKFAVNQLAVAVGWNNQINKRGHSSKILKEAIYNKMALGWTDERVKSWFAARVHIKDGANSVLGGEVGEVFTRLHELAYLNGMRYTDFYGREARKIVAGTSTMEAAEAKIRKQAAAKYSAFAEQIRAGQNAMDLAQPYIGATAEILELPVTDVDLFNKWISRAMTAKGKGGAQYPLWQFENELRADPLWRQTNNARESMFTIARSVARDFGFAY